MSKFELHVGSARYSEILEELLGELGAKEVLLRKYEADYQGFVKVGVLLEDGQVFFYEYSYGSCSGCDEWESRGLDDFQVKSAMRADAVMYSSREKFQEWLDKTNQVLEV
jgi:hypothetical protein